MTWNVEPCNMCGLRRKSARTFVLGSVGVSSAPTVFSRRMFLMNPYEPPATVSASLFGSVRTFRVGAAEPSIVLVSASLWKGIRSYEQNSEGVSGVVHRGQCKFEVGESEKHLIKIAVDGKAQVSVYVDGVLVDDNLFPKLRLRIVWIVGLFCFIVATIVSALFIVFLRYLFVR